MKGQGGQLFNKGHFLLNIYFLHTYSSEYIYTRHSSCGALVIYTLVIKLSKVSNICNNFFPLLRLGKTGFLS